MTARTLFALFELVRSLERLARHTTDPALASALLSAARDLEATATEGGHA
jgi:hypothetical protein